MTPTRLKSGHFTSRMLAGVFITSATAVIGLASPAGAEPQGHIPIPMGVGYFYGTFDESPNVQLIVGGTAEQFCKANPTDPFSAEPGAADGRLFFRNDGSIDIKANNKNQPIYLYHTDIADAPAWIEQVCADSIEADLFAAGTADLKVRVSVISDDLIDVFNSVNGTATGDDGTEYKVRAWADLVVENGVPVGSPEDFVGLELREIRG